MNQLLLLVLLVAPANAQETDLWSSPMVVARVGAVLVARLQVDPRSCQGKRGSELSFCLDRTYAPLGGAFGAVREEQTRTSDVALVRLLAYYIGETYTEKLQAEITRRGRRMLPVLDRARQATATCMFDPALAGICIREKDRVTMIDDCQKAILENRVLGDDWVKWHPLQGAPP